MDNWFPAIQQSVVMTLDKRLAIANELIKQYNEVLYPTTGVTAQLFVSGDGSMKDVHYDRIDTNERPPKLPLSTDYPSWWKKPGTFQCHCSQRVVLKRFLDSGLGTLLLLEDDAYFQDDFWTIFNHCAAFFQEHQWDCIYLGGYNNSHSYERVGEHILRCRGSAGFHAIILRRPIIQSLLELGPIGPMDEIAAKHLHKTHNCYQIYPEIVSQRDNEFSYVENAILDKPRRDYLG
jgi:hypothetical protein